jgi:flagellar biosynthetic protein FlhB
MAENNFEKTEAPTPRRRQEAREEGNIARSTDLTAACILLGSVLLLHMLGLRVLAGMKHLVHSMLTAAHAANATRADDLPALAHFTIKVLSLSIAPLTLAIMAVALLISVGQVGFVVSTRPLVPNFSRLSPLKGVSNLFNARAAIRVLMSVGKLLVIAALAAWVIYLDLPQILHIGQLQVAPAFAAAAELVYGLALKLALLLLILGILDYTFQRWNHQRELRMSKQEIKEEMKRMEGDPMVKQRRARVARQLALQRIAQAVPKADVIVTNPTHFSVALQYDSATMRAPKVIAKGADFMAMRIRQIAALHGIPLIERKPLAQALYHGVEIGQEIPPEHYAAVAEILAYVYRVSGRKSA